MSEIVQAVARVTVTVEIDVGGSWGPDCTTRQVFEQAKERALRALRQGLTIHHMTSGKDTKTGGRIIGEPVIRAIMIDGSGERQQ